MSESETQWRTIPEFENYEVSDSGVVRLLSGPILSARPNGPKGYLQVALTKDGIKHYVYVHRAVLRAFSGPPRDDQQARHLDGDNRNNLLSNLAWGTIEQNTADRVKHAKERARRVVENPTQDRLVAEVAALAGRAEVAAKAAERARDARDAAMVRARRGNVSYAQLQAATGLTRTGVYKALSSSVGGSLKQDSTSSGRVD